MLKLSAGHLGMLNVEYLVADANLAVEDLLIGLPVLRYLGVDSKTSIEERSDLLDGSNCSSISGLRNESSRFVRCLMIGRLNRISYVNIPHSSNVISNKSEVTSVPCKHVTRETAIKYYEVHEKVDPFTDSSSFDPLDIDQKLYITSYITKMLEDSSKKRDRNR